MDAADDDDWRWDLSPTVAYIAARGHTAVALQFPDDLLPHSTRVAALLSKRLEGSRCRVYVLAVSGCPPSACPHAVCHMYASAWGPQSGRTPVH